MSETELKESPQPGLFDGDLFVREEFTDIGDEHYIKPIVGSDGAQVGVMVLHRPHHGNGSHGEGRCTSSPFWKHAEREWSLDSAEPLTLSPSVLCGTCGDHGFIRGGRWVSA